MSNEVKRAKKALAQLTPKKLKEIKQPTSLDEARKNLTRFYGCHKNNFRVYLHKTDKKGNEIEVAEGSRDDYGAWEPAPWSQIKSDPHPAIMFQCALFDDEIVVDIDIGQIQNLRDIYNITDTGFASGKYDPYFLMNVWMPEAPTNKWDLLQFKAHIDTGFDMASDWLEHDEIYNIYNNNDFMLEGYCGFNDYLLKKRIAVPTYQINNSHTRYLHWLLLGPLAPYQFIETEKCKAA